MDLAGVRRRGTHYGAPSADRLRATVRAGIALFAAAVVPATTVTGYIVGAGAFWQTGQNPNLPSEPGVLLRVNIETTVGLLLIGLALACIHAVVLGIPALLTGYRLKLIRWWSCTVVGFLVGYAAMTVLVGLILPADNFSAKSFVSWGIAGAVGGLTFWLLWRFWVQRPKDVAVSSVASNSASG